MQLFCEPGQQVLFSQRQPYQEPIVLVFFLPVLVVRISEVSYSKQQYLNEELFSSIGNIGTGHLASRVWAKAPRVSRARPGRLALLLLRVAVVCRYIW